MPKITGPPGPVPRLRAGLIISALVFRQRSSPYVYNILFPSGHYLRLPRQNICMVHIQSNPQPSNVEDQIRVTSTNVLRFPGGLPDCRSGLSVHTKTPPSTNLQHIHPITLLLSIDHNDVARVTPKLFVF